MDWNLKIGLALLAFLTALAFTPPPFDPTAQVDPVSSRNLPPATRLLEVELNNGDLLLAAALDHDSQDLVLTGQGPQRTVPLKNIANLTAHGIEDSRLFLMGTDKFGRDIWSRVIAGARISLSIGLLSVMLAMTLGVLIGTLAAVGPSWLDSVLMRLVDGLLAFPAFFLVLALSALLEPTLGQVILILGSTSWMTITRLCRAEILSIKHRDFIIASRSLGIPTWRIALRHMLPNALTPLVVQATLLVGDLILAEAALSYFGLGVQPPTPSWGNMISDSQEALGTTWWIALFPGIAVAITVIAFNLLGDGLRTALDPKRRTADPKTILPSSTASPL
ncbi:MAG: ABC transporter permease [Deltaproteobacteria bacterium]|nr:ABC transporter permease [Deltaproteobacteria bacterium]